MGAAMEVLDNRLASFNKSKSKAKNAHKGWPHPESFVASPNALAHAGFFFKPTKENIDNVQCFICKKELGGWDESDNPYEIHFQKCPKCPWAIVRCSVEFDFFEDGQFSITDESRLPKNKILEKARLDTFIAKSKWPHDASKTHGVKSERMAAAGFVYTPEREGDDSATCFYCGLALSGWDEDDDPIEEHQKRKIKTGKPCPFFEAKVDVALTIEELKPSKSVRKSNAPKKTGEEEESAEREHQAGSVGKSKSAPRSKKSVKHALKAVDLDHDEDVELREDDDPSLKVKQHPPSKSKAKKSTKKSLAVAKAASSTTQMNDEDHEDASGNKSDAAAAPRERTRTQSGKKAAAKGQSKQKSKAPVSPVDGKPASKYQDFEVDVVEEDEPRNGRSKKASKSRSLSRSKSKGRSMGRQSSKPPTSDNESRPPSRVSSRPISEDMDVNDNEASEVDDSRAPLDPEPAPERKPTSKTKAKVKKPKSTGVKGKGKLLATEVDDFGHTEADDPAHDRIPSRQSDLDDVTNTVASQPSAVLQALTSENSAPAKSRQKDVLNVKRTEQRFNRVSKTPEKAVDDVFERQPADDGMDVDSDPAEVRLQTDVEPAQKPPDSSSPSPKPLSIRQVEAVFPSKKASNANAVGQTRSDETTSGRTKLSSQLRIKSRETSPLRQVHKAADDISTEERISSRRDSGKENRMQQSIVASRPSQSTAGPPAPRTPERQILRFVSPRQVSPSPQRPAFTSQRSLSPVIASSPIPSPEKTRSPSPPFIPPLATVPRVHDKDLTAEERDLTVEQWIRREMENECEILRKDGERRIQMFRERAEEVRKEIEAL